MARFAQFMVLAWVLAGVGVPVRAAAEDGEPRRFSLVERERLVSPSARRELQRVGIDFQPFLTADLLAVRGPGESLRVQGLGTVDAVLAVDLDASVGWTGAALMVHGVATFGDQPTRLLADVQGTNNIEAPPALRLLEAHFEQELLDGRLSLLAGLYDTNSEFDVLPAGALFVHSSFGMGGDVGTSGVNGPSTYPFTSLAFRIQVRPTPGLFGRAVVADGVPQDPDRPGDTAVLLRGRDGVFLMAEVGVLNLPGSSDRVQRRFEEVPPPEERTYGNYGKFAVGVWGYTTEFDDPSGGRARGTVGAYALAQQAVYREEDTIFDGVSLFARVGAAMERGHAVRAYGGAGFFYEGMLELPRQDQFGVGVAAALPVETEAWEVALEGTYRYPVLGWLLVQPEAQVVFGAAGAGTDQEDGLALGVRSLVRL